MPERVKLTKATVDRLHAQSSEYTAWDTEVAGFGCRVFSSGRKSYVYQYRPRDSRRARKVTIGPHGALAPAEARKIALTHAGSVARGGDPGMERSEARRTESSLTVRGLFEQYREWLEEAGRSRVDDDRSKYRRHIDQPLGRRRAVSVTLEDVERLHRSIADRYPTQANRVVGLIKRTYFFGIRRGLLPQDTPNPATGVEASREPPRKRVLSRQELRHLNDALTELRREALSHRMPGGDSQRRDRLDSLDAIELAIYTAMRLNEVLRLRWDELREDDDELVLTRRKSDRLRSTDMNTVYLPAQVGSIFERRSRESEWVFPGKLPSQHRTSIARVWRQLRKSAGLDDLHFHDLRKIAPTMGMITGESREILGKILGDRTPAVIDRYAHLIDRTPHAAARRIGDAIHRAMNGRELSPEQDQHP